MRKILLALLVFGLLACSNRISPTSPTDSPAVSKATGTMLTSIPEVSATATISASMLLSPTEKPQPSPTISIASPAIEIATISPEAANAQEFPDTNLVLWRVVASGLERPVDLVSAKDSSGRLFILEQPGVIRILQDGKLKEMPFLDIREQVGSEGNEQGLLGLAFHPSFSQNGNFYINYTDKQGDTVIARYLVAPSNADQADFNSEERLLYVSQPYPNHNGGMLAFGPDGMLYIGLGDGGSAGDPKNNAQSLGSLLGKILRIDVNQPKKYITPSDNQFASTQLPEIWAYGLRNPWRFSFDHQTGDLYIGDVGQNKWEEINFLPANNSAGVNFGWRYFEGNHPYSDETPPPDIQLTFPIAEYSHAEGCSVTGGVVYRGGKLPDWNGVYLYGDFCSGNVSGLLRNPQGEWQQKLLFENVGRISSFGEDEQGEVYLVDLSGQIFRLEAK